MLVEDDMVTRRLNCMLLGAVVLGFLSHTVLCPGQDASKPAKAFYQAYVVAPSYEYELSGRKDRVKGYVIKVEAPERLTSPGLVVLVSGVAPGEGHVTVNGHTYDLPALMGETGGPARDTEKNQPGKEGWYSFSSGDDIIGKVVIPL